MRKSDELQVLIYNAHEQIISAIQQEWSTKVEAQDYRGIIEFDEDCFEDEAHNILIGVGAESVYFGNAESPDEYPIDDLGLQDGIEVLRLLEDKKG